MKRITIIGTILATGWACAQTTKPKIDPRRPDIIKEVKQAKLAEPFDPYKSSQTDKLNPSQVVIQVNASSTLSIAEMACEINQFSHDTRAVTCGMSANLPSYSGVLIVYFKNGSVWSKSVFVEQPIYNGRMAVWGMAVIAAYGSEPITKVEFSNGGPLASWEQTPEAKKVLDGTYNFGKAVQYPPSVKISEMNCVASEFLVGKSQAEINPTYVFTCGLAGDQQYYGGSLAVWWHQYEERIAAPETPLPIPRNYSTQNTANHSAYVHISQDIDTSNNQLKYWGFSAFSVESPVKLAFDRVQFYPEREISSSESIIVVPQPPVKPPSAFEKVYFRNRYCDEDSCIRPPG